MKLCFVTQNGSNARWLKVKPCAQCIVCLKTFIIRAPLFGHKTQGLCFCYLPNTKSKWNKFKWKILDKSNYDNFMVVLICHMRT